MEDDAPYLTFKLASVGFGRSVQTIIQVWKIIGVPDHRGRVADLKAEIIVMFTEEQLDYRVNTVSLQKHFLVYSAREKGTTTIVDWTNAEQFSRRRVLEYSSEVCVRTISDAPR